MTGKLKGEKILLGPSSFSATDKGPIEQLVSTGAEIIDNPYKRRLTKTELLDLLGHEITGIIAGLEPLDEEVMSVSNLKVISRCGSGMSNVDQEAAKKLGIIVVSTPDAPVSSVAELSLGAMLSLLRMIPVMDRDLHTGKWNKKIGTLLEGKTVVIIGFGRIGRRLSDLLVPFNVEILIVDPYLENKVDGKTVLSLNEALPRADIICIHSSGEECMMGSSEFDMVKEGAILLNAARGSLVDEKALIGALDSGKITGAWLDVFKEEPYSGALTGYEQVILSPHVGSYTRECRKRMETESVINLVKGFEKIREG